jgi:hypothetical protein
MNNSYSSRKKKIYHDYSSFHDDRLIEMVRNSREYNTEVIEVIKDILKERNVSFPGSENSTYSFAPAEPAPGHDYTNEYKHDEKVRTFVDKLREKEPEEILATITRYSEFRPETVEAALTVAVDRGLISWDLKNLLKEQIDLNLSNHWNRKGHFGWEKNNAFVELVKGYSDDDIYRILEEPSGIVIDVYHAILATALVRELISQEDFNGYFERAKKALRSYGEIINDEFNDFIKDSRVEKLLEELPDPRIEREKYWKCPSCGESVELDLPVCWNCQTNIPENFIHPDTEVIAKEIAENSRPGIGTWILLGLTFIGLILGIVLRTMIHTRHPFANYGILIFVGYIAFVGIFYYLFIASRGKS